MTLKKSHFFRACTRDVRRVDQGVLPLMRRDGSLLPTWSLQQKHYDKRLISAFHTGSRCADFALSRLCEGSKLRTQELVPGVPTSRQRGETLQKSQNGFVRKPLQEAVGDAISAQPVLLARRVILRRAVSASLGLLAGIGQSGFPSHRCVNAANAMNVFDPASAPLAASTDVYDVKQYGAKGDGVTDDTAAIQVTIDAVPADGGTVWFPAGTYIVSPTATKFIRIKGNLTFAGVGASSVLKIKDGNGDWYMLFSPTNLSTRVDHTTFQDLAFDSNIQGNSTATISTRIEHSWQIFIYICAGSNLRVQRCRFAPCSGVWAISLNGSDMHNCAVTDCSFQFVMRNGNPDYDNSMVYVQGTNCALMNNRFETKIIPNRGGRACMEVHGGPATVSGNTSVGFRTGVNITGAYYAGGSAGDITCEHNTFADALLGIIMWPTSPNILSGVTIRDNTVQLAQVTHGDTDSCGIVVFFSDEAKTLASHLTITGNTIRFQDEGAGRSGDRFNAAGIGLRNLGGVDACVIDGNYVELAPAGGIVIGLEEPGDRWYRNVRVTNNTIVNPGQNVKFESEYRAGVYLTSNISSLIISGNQIRDTFAARRAATGIFFAPGVQLDQNVQVSGNIATATVGTLPLVLPSGAQ